MAQSAIELAMSGATEPAGKAKKKTVSQAVFDNMKEQLEGKLGRQSGRIKQMAENAGEAGLQAVNGVETLATTFMYSMAKGGIGADKMKVADVSVPGAVGLGMMAWGLYDTLTGKGGSHQFSLGLGLVASDIADIGNSAGIKLADAYNKDKKVPAGSGDGSSSSSSTSSSTTATDTVPAKVSMGGPERELEVGGRDRHRVRRDDADGAPNANWFDRHRRPGHEPRRGAHELIPVRVLNMAGMEDEEDLDQGADD